MTPDNIKGAITLQHSTKSTCISCRISGCFEIFTYTYDNSLVNRKLAVQTLQIQAKECAHIECTNGNLSCCHSPCEPLTGPIPVQDDSHNFNDKNPDRNKTTLLKISIRNRTTVHKQNQYQTPPNCSVQVKCVFA